MSLFAGFVLGVYTVIIIIAVADALDRRARGD